MAAGSPQGEGAACFVAPQWVNHRRHRHKIVKMVKHRWIPRSQWRGLTKIGESSRASLDYKIVIGVARPRSAKVLHSHALGGQNRMKTGHFQRSCHGRPGWPETPDCPRTPAPASWNELAVPRPLNVMIDRTT